MLKNNNVLGDVKRNKEIGAINGVWGPFFRISFDLIIHSLDQYGFSNILSFRTMNWWGGYPHVDLHSTGYLRFLHTVDFLQKNVFDFVIEKNQWYNIVIEQKLLKRKRKERKAYYTVTIDGNLIHNISLPSPYLINEIMNPILKNLKVFAGDNYFPGEAIASYKNLFWENLPDILFDVFTPTAVSLEIKC